MLYTLLVATALGASPPAPLTPPAHPQEEAVVPPMQAVPASSGNVQPPFVPVNVESMPMPSAPADGKPLFPTIPAQSSLNNISALSSPYNTVSYSAAQPAGPEPINIEAPVMPPPPPKPPEAPPGPPPPAPPDRWFLMRELQGTWYGAMLDNNRTTISGWLEQSYTASQNKTSNMPVVWNDRANQYMLNSFWLRLDRSVVTSGTMEPTWGYRFDFTAGTDYRYSLMRGLLNDQLLNQRVAPNELNGFAQNMYGIDLIQFYVNGYIPNLFAGTDIRAGRLFTPWGVESLEGVSTPFVSRSYAFNWSPPFTHMGIMVSPTFNAQWSGKFMLANGNDVFLEGNGPQEMRSVGQINWTSLDKRDSVSFGWTLGRGKFNAGAPFNPATISEQFEPAGRNNINVFDIVYTHTFNSRATYQFELLYGYQTNVPANVPGGVVRPGADEGTAHWGSWCQYFTYVISPELTSITRFELFDDWDGQRTGFTGLYEAITTGVNYHPYKWLTIRPEVRYDYNGTSRPFERSPGVFAHGLLTAALDTIIRW